MILMERGEGMGPPWRLPRSAKGPRSDGNFDLTAMTQL